ncbi:MAG: DUF2273 domain-containing protein [Paenibacillus sp.]|uniref:Small integral membrane protein n=1 Tax=Paenibacillus aquistagni TaxID=1852522 RepID=A0A1X7JKQ5_9BACL|nr:DUF2273 domain-containing protein [Paenibacillus aquistagni]MBR2568966.1 DUF2273 domain-containing protein [Paenibacillus sp.]NMM54497.1 DUF2273 domain-containing protein [Paenibacillus aquistagni]SMG27904.1 Small integral membrane protein [Paenibacillus aquistagni]
MWKQLWESHGGRIIGIIAGCALGILYLIVGFWNMLFVALLVFIGYTFGKHKDLNLGPVFPLQQIRMWLSERWRWLK